MILSGKTELLVNGRSTRVCGRHFNRALKAQGAAFVALLPTGERVEPSRALSWEAVAQAVRAGKKVQAKTL